MDKRFVTLVVPLRFPLAACVVHVSCVQYLAGTGEWKIDPVVFAVRVSLSTYECSLQDEFFTLVGLMHISLNTSENRRFRSSVGDE